MFSIILFYNGESRDFIILIHIMVSKFNIVMTVFKTCRRKISILNTKYYESPFDNFWVRKNVIMITEVSKNNSNKSNNEYITWKAYLGNSYYEYELSRNLATSSKNKTFFLFFPYNSFQNVVRVLPTFSNWLRRLDPSLHNSLNSIVAYKRDFFRNMASENGRKALGVRNAFSYVDLDRVRGFGPKKRFWNLIQACVIINSVSLRT